MCYEIVFAPEAVADLKRLNAHARAEVKEAIEQHLRHQPAKTSKSRIKRLRGLSKPQYRLRVGEIRVFCDLSVSSVEVLAVVEKSQAQAWLENTGESR